MVTADPEISPSHTHVPLACSLDRDSNSYLVVARGGRLLKTTSHRSHTLCNLSCAHRVQGN